MESNVNQFVGWAQLASGLGAICLVVLAVILRKVWNGTDNGGDKIDAKLNTMSTNIKAGVKSDIESLLIRFDKMCHERQESCKALQTISKDSTCRKLSDHIIFSDERYRDLLSTYKGDWKKLEEVRQDRWCKLNKQREKDWAQHEKIMKEIWDAINKHSHEGIDGSGTVIRKD